MASSSNQATAPPMPSAPLPTAPPSYEEAVGITTGPPMPSGVMASGVPYMHPPVSGAPPYPVSGAQMPMPNPCKYQLVIFEFELIHQRVGCTKVTH